MSASTGNFRGQRTQSSCNGYKTLGSSIVSGNNSGCFKRIFINALENTNNNYDLAFTKTLGISKNYYNSTSNSYKYQQPTLSGKKFSGIKESTAGSLSQVNQSAYTISPYPNTTIAYFAINNGAYTINGYIYLDNGQYYAYFDYPIYYYISILINGDLIYDTVQPQNTLNTGQYGYYVGEAVSYGPNGQNGQINLNLSLYNGGPFIFIQGTFNLSSLYVEENDLNG